MQTQRRVLTAGVLLGRLPRRPTALRANAKARINVAIEGSVAQHARRPVLPADGAGHRSGAAKATDAIPRCKAAGAIAPVRRRSRCSLLLMVPRPLRGFLWLAGCQVDHLQAASLLLQGLLR